MTHADTPAFQVIRGGLVLDVAARRAERRDILIEGAEIREVGAPGLAAPEAAVEIAAADRLVIPGLVNAHTHGHGSLGKGQGDRWSLELLLNASPWLGGAESAEEKRVAAELNAAEMVLKGCTAAYDMYFEFPTPSLEGMGAALEGYAALGLRVALAPMMADRTFFQAIPGLIAAMPEAHRARLEAAAAADAETHLAACRALLEGWSADRERARPALGPTIPHHCTDDFLRGIRDLAAEHEVGVQMHLAESKVQAVAGPRVYGGRSLAAHLDGLGLVTERFVGAHGVWLDADDMKRLADRGAAIAHNPSSNLRLGSGVAPAREMLDAGLTVGLGTDGSASSDNQNMFEAMRAAANVSRIAAPDPERWLGAWEVIEAATLGGARVMGMAGRIGEIAPGRLADLVMLDLGNLNYVPLNDAALQLVNCEDSSAVESVMIGGRFVLRDRAFTAFDLADLRRRAERATEAMRARSLPARAGAEAVARFVSSHCVGLACQHHHVARALPHGGAQQQ